MNTQIQSLIESEQAKIDLLRSKIKDCERRIAVFRSLLDGDDELDVALARRVVSDSPAEVAAQVNDSKVKDASLISRGLDLPAPLEKAPRSRLAADPGASGDSAAADGFPKKALNGKTLALLKFAGSAENGEKSINDFLSFAEQHGIEKSRQSMRAFLFQYKTAYGLLQSNRDGCFHLSDRGVAYLDSLQNKTGGTISAE